MLILIEYRKFKIFPGFTFSPFKKYLFFPPLTIFLVIEIFSVFIRPNNFFEKFLSLRIKDTDANSFFVFSFLWIKSSSVPALMMLRFVKPRTKQIPSKMFDFPDPFVPVIELNCGFRFEKMVFVA